MPDHLDLEAQVEGSLRVADQGAERGRPYVAGFARVLTVGGNSEPVDPEYGDRHIVGDAPVDWGPAHAVAYFNSDGVWEFVEPGLNDGGMRFYCVSDERVYEWKPSEVTWIVATSARHEHEQNVASTTWTINHNLARKPVVEARSTGGAVIFGTVVHTSDNQTVITFNTAIAGTASCS